MNRALNPIRGLVAGAMIGSVAGTATAGVKYGDQRASVPWRAGMGTLFGAAYPLIGGERDQGYSAGGRFGRSVGLALGGTAAGAGIGYGAMALASRFGRRLR